MNQPTYLPGSKNIILIKYRCNFLRFACRGNNALSQYCKWTMVDGTARQLDSYFCTRLYRCREQTVALQDVFPFKFYVLGQQVYLFHRLIIQVRFLVIYIRDLECRRISLLFRITSWSCRSFKHVFLVTEANIATPMGFWPRIDFF